MTISRPLRFVLQLIVLTLVVVGAYDVREGDAFDGAILIVLAVGLWLISRIKTAT
jgi:hypothetical protein